MKNYQIFHLYNQSNGNKTIFHTDQNYCLFLGKLVRQMKPAATILGYCIMPNHFHLLVIPKHELNPKHTMDGESNERLPTLELSKALQSMQMGYTKAYNAFYRTSGSQFRQNSKSKYHGPSLAPGLNYLHQNPVVAQLVDHPSEWGYSSFNEYEGLVQIKDCVCDVELGREILGLPPLEFKLD